MKKFSTSLLAVSLAVSFAFPALAAPSIKRTFNADGACMSTAVGKRDASIITSLDTYTTTVKNALIIRRDALKAAWLLVDKAQRETAIKAAHTAFNGTWKRTKQSLAVSRKTAWAGFKTDAKTCKVALPASDSSAETSDMNM